VASPFELFCDLLFAAVFAALAEHLGDDLSWPRLSAFVGLFVPVFWLWVIYTFYADRYDTDDALQRLITLTGMLALCALATAAVRTPGSGDILFVGSYLAARAAPAALYLRSARRVSAARPIARNYLIGSLLAAGVWVTATAGFSAPYRYWGWVLAVTTELALPFVGRRTVARTDRHVDHLTERYGLLAIIVIGEAVLGVINGFTNQPWTAARVVTATGCFTVAAALWWTYFNRGDHTPIGSHFWRLQIFSLGHLPATAALTAIGPGAATLIRHANDPHPSQLAAVCLGGGAATYLAATAAVRSAFTTPRESVVVSRMAAVIVIVALTLAATLLTPAIFTSLLTAILVLLVTAEGRALNQPEPRGQTSQHADQPVAGQ